MIVVDLCWWHLFMALASSLVSSFSSSAWLTIILSNLFIWFLQSPQQYWRGDQFLHKGRRALYHRGAVLWLVLIDFQSDLYFTLLLFTSGIIIIIIIPLLFIYLRWTLRSLIAFCNGGTSYSRCAFSTVVTFPVVPLQACPTRLGFICLNFSGAEDQALDPAHGRQVLFLWSIFSALCVVLSFSNYIEFAFGLLLFSWISKKHIILFLIFRDVPRYIFLLISA